MGLTSPGAALREIFQRPETFIMPFGSLPLHAQMAQHAGFEAFQLSGGMSAWWAEGASDTGWLTMTEVVAHARRVARSVDIPVYSDADTGYGSPLMVQRTVQEMIGAGIAGIHLEDQRDPKKSGGTSGVELVSDAEAIGRLTAAVDARDREDEDFVIVARTDGYGAAGGSIEEALRRGRLYKEETGVDMIFYEGLETQEQVELVLRETPGPAYVAGVTLTGKWSLAELTAMGQSIEPVPFVLPGVHEVWKLLLEVKEAGDAKPFARYLEKMYEANGTPLGDLGWGDRLGRPTKAEVKLLEEKYLPAESQRDYVNTRYTNDNLE